MLYKIKAERNHIGETPEKGNTEERLLCCFKNKKGGNMKNKGKWTEEQINLLREHYPYDSWEELLKIFSFSSKNGIIKTASKNHITRDIYNNCHRTEEEVEFIINNITKMTVEEISKTLQRNYAFVYHILKDNNILLPGHKGGHLKKEDEELFQELYPQYTNKYLSEKHFPYLTPQQLRVQAKRFGLVKNEEKGVKWYDKEVLLENFENIVRQLGRVPMLTEFQELGLPSEATFRRYFGGVNCICKLLGIERTHYFGNSRSNSYILLRDLNDNICFSKIEQQIGNFLIQNNINFEKEFLYNKLMPIEDCGKKRFDWKIDNKYIEYFGLINFAEYRKVVQEKMILCQQYSIDLLPLYPNDMRNQEVWQTKILQFIKEI